MIIKHKLSDIAKDLGKQNKEVIELLEKVSKETKKHTAALSENELNQVFEHYTAQFAVDSLEDYMQAMSSPKAEAKKEAPQQPKAQAPAANAPQKAQQGARPAQNTQARPAQSSQSRPVQNTQSRPVQNTQSRPVQNAQPQQAQNGARPVQNAQPQQAQNTANAAQKQQGQDAAKHKESRKPPEARKERIRNLKPEKETKESAPRREVVTVTVDTRTTDVNLDKFNDKYTELASAKNIENRRKPMPAGNKQKFNKNRFGGRNNNAFGKKRAETESERLQRLQLEKARNAQLKVSIPDEITVGELASRLKANVAQVIKKLMGLGIMANMTEEIDFDTASIVAEEMGAKVIKEVRVTIEDRLFETDDDADESLQDRPPVVVVMGHVDHGKTSILDAIRKTRVTDGEAGGITQHIGAYQVESHGKPITFLDTPGHEAFTSMRARGANLTDIAVLVVAADDGIMPQTVESINHAKQAGVSIIVAINKIDKPEANPDKVMEQLTVHEIVPEAWGGDVVCVKVSAKTGEGIQDLLEMINLTSEVKELKANPDRRAKGAVIEARLDKGKGPVATILVQRGTLRRGDVVIAGTTVGRVRVMSDDLGNVLEEAGPSTPVEITGLTAVPSAGDLFDAVEDERLARELADRRQTQSKEQQFNAYKKVTLDNLFSQIAEGERKELAIIVKADVQGSAEAVKQSLEKISNEEVRVRVIHTGVGAINKSDIMLANAGNAIVIGFNVRPDETARAEAASAEVEMRMYRVIYDAINDVTDAMKGMLAPKYREVELGRAEVRNVFKISSAGTIAGSYVKEGKITRSAKIRLVRDGIVITEDEIDSLRRFKDDVKEVATSFECGIGLVKFTDIKEGDVMEAFIIEEYRD